VAVRTFLVVFGSLWSWVIWTDLVMEAAGTEAGENGSWIWDGGWGDGDGVLLVKNGCELRMIRFQNARAHQEQQRNLDAYRGILVIRL